MNDHTCINCRYDLPGDCGNRYKGNDGYLHFPNDPCYTPKPKKIFALVLSEREKECTHEAGFYYTGKMPCTGPKKCYMCGTREEDA